MSETTGNARTTGSGDDYGDFKGLLDQMERHAAAASPERAAAAAPSAAPGLGDLCRVWPVIRTALQIVLNFPIPGKAAIRAAIQVVDSLCGGNS